MNIGKTKVVPDDDQAAVLADYGRSARLLAPYADYLVVNVSSPNTPGLRNLQAVERLEPLLAHVRRTADEVTRDGRGSRGGGCRCWSRSRPTSPTTTCCAVADLALASGLDGVIATNTTISRAGLRTDADRVSDRRRRRALRRAARRALPRRCSGCCATGSGRDLCLVGVGGITTLADARARLDAGATLLQGYTGVRLRGPALAEPPRRGACAT